MILRIQSESWIGYLMKIGFLKVPLIFRTLKNTSKAANSWLPCCNLRRLGHWPCLGWVTNRMLRKWASSRNYNFSFPNLISRVVLWALQPCECQRQHGTDKRAVRLRQCRVQSRCPGAGRGRTGTQSGREAGGQEQSLPHCCSTEALTKHLNVKTPCQETKSESIGITLLSMCNKRLILY